MVSKSKQALIEQMKIGRAKLEAALNGLTPEQMVNPGVETNWSIRDVMAHIMFWEQRALYWLKATRDGLDPHDNSWNDSVDNLNARNYNANKNRPVEDVLDEERSVFNTVLRLVEATSEVSLFHTQFSWLEGDSLATRIGEETYEHIDDHIDALKFWHDNIAGS